jgi:hypothetical protein
MMSSSSGSCGNERNRSLAHISSASTQPLAMPAMAPITTPTITATSMAATPTASDTRPPWIIRASRSWPRSSVPNGCVQEGPASWAPKSMSSIGVRQSNGPIAMPITSSSNTAMLITASR